MNAHVLLNLLNEFGKSDKMPGLLSILLLFRSEFYKFNNTGAGMLDSIYHMTLKYLKSYFSLENINIFPSFTQNYNGCYYVCQKSVNHLWFIDFISWRCITHRHDGMR